MKASLISIPMEDFDSLCADKARLDALDALPYALSLDLHPNEIKSADAPSLRSQIDYFVERNK